MATRLVPDPSRVPAHVLFPESYEASRRAIARDFALFGALIVVSVVLGALLHAALTSGA